MSTGVLMFNQQQRVGQEGRSATARLPGQDRADRRALRDQLRHLLSSISSIPRVAKCGTRPITRMSTVAGDRTVEQKAPPPTIRARLDPAAGRVAHFTGIQMCGSVHACTVCSPKIRHERSLDVDLACSRWLEQYGVGSVMMLTLTMPHDMGDDLAPLLRCVRKSLGRLLAGRQWQSDKETFGIAHYIVAHDCTVGPHGWHPHLHLILLGRHALNDFDVVSLESSLFDRWAAAIEAHDYRRPSRQYGISLERARNRADVSRYVCQVIAGDADDARAFPIALEVARGDLKTSRRDGHRTPWQVLEDIHTRRASDGEWTELADRFYDRDVALWHEWERETKGLPSIRWSNGLRVAVSMADEKTDDEILNTEIGGVDVYEFTDPKEFRVVVSSARNRQTVLRAAETGQTYELTSLIRDMVRRYEEKQRKRRRPHPSNVLGIPSESGGTVPRNSITSPGDAA